MDLVEWDSQHCPHLHHHHHHHHLNHHHHPHYHLYCMNLVGQSDRSNGVMVTGCLLQVQSNVTG